MKKPLLIICSILLSFAVWAQNSTKRKMKIDDFYLEYTSSTKTIIIKANAITVQEWIEQYDSPMSSMPASRKELVKTSMIPVADISALKELIKSNGFMSLSKDEYGGSAEDRYYPYMITVKTNSRQKKILYRSTPDPSAEASPKAFSEVEKKLNEMIASIKEWK
jgi:hypothetical protein